MENNFLYSVKKHTISAIAIVMAIIMLVPASTVGAIAAEDAGISPTISDCQSYEMVAEEDLQSETLDFFIKGTDNYDYAYDVLSSVNETRTSLGLHELNMDKGLLDIAMQRAAEIAVYYSHTRPDNTSCFSIAPDYSSGWLGENIAIGYRSPEDVMSGWLSSSGHYANIVDENYLSIGVGCFEASDGTLCWVQFFSSELTESVSKSGAKENTHGITAVYGNLSLYADEISVDMPDAKIGDEFNFVIKNKNIEFPYQSQLIATESFDYYSTDDSIISHIGNGEFVVNNNGAATIGATMKSNNKIELSCQASLGHEHSFTYYVSDNNATCGAYGTKTAVCDVDGCTAIDTVIDTDSIGAHTPSDWIIDIEASFSVNGSKHKECTVCGEVLETEVIPATGHNPSDWIIEQEPTCSTEGYKYKVCTDCGLFLEIQAIPTTEHISSDWIIDAEASFSVNGSKHKECTVCGEVLETEVIPATGHNPSDWIIEQEPTCSTEGYRYKKCLDCGLFLEFQSIPTTEHKSSDWIVEQEPTCSSEGYKYKACTECAEILEDEIIARREHILCDWIIDKKATCTINGSKHKECVNCGEWFDEQTILPTGHISSDWIVDIEATFSTNGSKHKECTICGEILETATIPATGHNPSDWIIEQNPTCSTEGYKYKKCVDCGLFLEFQTIPVTEHVSSDWIIDKKVDCTTDGSKHKECVNCGEWLDEEIIIKIGHSSGDWEITKVATCTAEGTKAKKCIACGEVVETQVIAKKAHTPGEWKTIKAETCITDGEKHKACTVCKEVLEKQTITKTGHTEVKDPSVAATCTKAGKTEGSHCSVCKAVIKAQKTVEATGHKIGDWIIDKEPTCTKEGRKHKACTVCGAVTPDTVIPKIGHTEVKDPAVEATCTKPGKTEGSHCSVCKAVIKAQKTVEATGHKMSDWIIDKEPTCTKEGRKHKACTVCGAVTPDTVLPPTGHTPSDWIIDEEATVYKAGSKHKECTICKAVIGTKVIDQLKCVAPKIKKLENTADGVKITWGKVRGADTYEVYRKTGKGKYSKIGTTKKTGFTDKKAKSGKKYYYIVKAVNEAGVSAASKSKSIYYLADSVLKTPKCTKRGVDLEWSKVAGADGYVIYRKTGKGDYKKITTVKGYKKVKYTDKSAKKGKTYTYKVKAYKSKTYSASSNGKKIKDRY